MDLTHRGLKIVYDSITVFLDLVRFEVSTAVTMKNGVLWDVTRATWRNIPEDAFS
jgi:hypothetical protein